MLQQLINISEGFAGSDIEGAVRDVAIKAVIHGDNLVVDTLYEKCFKNIVPLSKTAPEKIEAIRTWGRERALHASGVAWENTMSDIILNKRSIIV
jgi:hypothetical protein